MLSKRIINELLDLGCIILRNELLSKHCSFRIGGPVDFFIKIPNEAALSFLLQYVNRKKIYILGSGSNVLFPDNGYNGIVATLVGEFKYCFVNKYNITCGGGTQLSDIVNLTTIHNLTGLEFAIGIPGTIGGATYCNAGLQTKWISSVINGIEFFNENSQKAYLDRKDISFKYRTSSLNTCIITQVKLRLNKKSKSNYNINKYLYHRIQTQPMSLPNAGSIFKNPIGLNAGKLIEDAQLKGVCIGKAKISEKHGNFILNTGGACANEVLYLIKLIQAKVKQKFNITLEPEIKIIK